MSILMGPLFGSVCAWERKKSDADSSQQNLDPHVSLSLCWRPF